MRLDRSTTARLFTCFAGVVLLVAAALKSYRASTDPGPVTDLVRSDLFAIVLIGVELFFGMWFLSGVFPDRMRWVGCGLFALFSLASFAAAASGAKSCDCFGQQAIHPTAMASFDAVMAFAFYCLPASHRVPVSSRQAVTVVALAAVALVAVTPLAVHRQVWGAGIPALAIEPPTVDLGVVVTGSRSRVSATVVNKTGRTQTIATFHTSCSCLEVQPTTLKLRPHGIGHIDLRYDSAKQLIGKGRYRLVFVARDVAGAVLCRGYAAVEVESHQD